MVNLDEEYKRVGLLLNKTNDNLDNYRYGERVEFSCNGVSGLYGVIKVKDYYGGGIYLGVTPTVDIMCDDGILYKHISIVDIKNAYNLIVKNEKIDE